MIGLPSISWRGLAIALAASSLVALGWGVEHWRLGAQIAELKALRANEQRNEAYAQVKAVDAARLEEQRRTAAQTETANEAIKQLQALRDSAVAADVASRELRARVTALANAARRPDDPGPVTVGAATPDPVVLLADVLGRADQRAGDLAQYADAVRIVGQKCERDYDALTGASPAAD